MTSFTTYPRTYMILNYFPKWTYVKLIKKYKKTCNFMTKYNHIRCFRAVGIRYVLLLLFFWKNRNWYWKSQLSFRNLNLLQQLLLFLAPRGMTSLLKVSPCLIMPHFQFYLETYNRTFQYIMTLKTRNVFKKDKRRRLKQ